MATIQIRSKKKYVRAIGVLMEIGSYYRAKPTRKFVLNLYQIQCLQDAGILPKRKRKKGEKEVRWPPPRAIPTVIIIPSPSRLRQMGDTSG